MTINGVPLHPLVVHAAVVFVPLSALATFALVVPRMRWAARWPALVLAAATLVAFWALPHVTALRQGEDREARLPALVRPLTLALPLLAVVVLVLVVITGDAGARAVWQG